MVQKYVYPNTNVTIDTIAEQTNLTEFVYNGDTIVFENLFLPLYSEYDKDDDGHYQKVIGTTRLRYNKKHWLLPQKWKDERLSIDYVMHIKTKDRRYLTFLLTNTAGDSYTERNRIVAAVDIDNDTVVSMAKDYSSDLTSFLDYDGDGILEYTFMSEKVLGKKKEPNYQKYTLTLCHLTPDGNPEKISGDPLSISNLDSIKTREMVEELIRSSQE